MKSELIKNLFSSINDKRESEILSSEPQTM